MHIFSFRLLKNQNKAKKNCQTLLCSCFSLHLVVILLPFPLPRIEFVFFGKHEKTTKQTTTNHFF